MTDVLSINLNLAGLWSTFARKLQHMLDVLRVLEVGVSSVTQERVEEAIQFLSFQPANGTQRFKLQRTVVPQPRCAAAQRRP